jgi:hypothetical protein
VWREDTWFSKMEDGLGAVYAMGPRIPMVRRDAREMMGTTALGLNAPSPVLSTRAEKTTECTDARLCEKPVGGSDLTIPIALGVA